MLQDCCYFFIKMQHFKRLLFIKKYILTNILLSNRKSHMLIYKNVNHQSYTAFIFVSFKETSIFYFSSKLSYAVQSLRRTNCCRMK